MRKVLLLALPLALAEPESADDFASRIGQNGEALDPAQRDPDAPNTANAAPPSGADLTQLQKLGDIGGVDLGPRDGGCTLMVGKDEMIIAGAMNDGAIPGKAVVRVGDSLTMVDADPERHHLHRRGLHHLSRPGSGRPAAPSGQCHRARRRRPDTEL